MKFHSNSIAVPKRNVRNYAPRWWLGTAIALLSLRGFRLRRKERSSGVALLEASIAMLFLLPLTLGVWGLADQYLQWSRLSRIVDAHLYDGAVKPLTLDPNLGGNFGLASNDAVLENFVQALVAALRQDLAAEFPGQDAGNGSFMVEAGFARIAIDSQSGLAGTVQTYLRSAGILTVPGADLAKTDLTVEFNRLAQLPASTAQGAPSFLAAPSGLFGRGSAQDAHYLPISFVLGVRAFRGTDRGISGVALRHIGLEPIAYDWKVIILRGQLDL